MGDNIKLTQGRDRGQTDNQHVANILNDIVSVLYLCILEAKGVVKTRISMTKTQERVRR